MSVRASFDVFFSYHSHDRVLVEAVARALTDRGLRVFLDRWYLAPGRPWPQALERALATCNSVAVFLGGDGLGPWQQRERDLALERQGRHPDFPVIPVLLTRTDPAVGFLTLNTWVDLSASVADESALDTLCAAIRREPPGPAGLSGIEAIKAEICPYRGLRSFREEDAAFFCGRETFTNKLVETVRHASLVTVVGASGSGKSSVVRAGMIPRLRRTEGGRVWEIASLAPTDRPLHSLAAALVPILEPQMTRVDRLAEINKLAAHLADGTVVLRDVAADVLRIQPGTDRLLLFVDQWEELYTLVADAEVRRRFLGQILDATATGRVAVVLALRGDFFGHALADRSFADRLEEGQVNLGPMTEAELRRSIVQPADVVRLQFQPGLVDRILEDVGQEPGNLPLMEFVLATLWEQRQGATMTHDAYERMGGVQGAIAARADAEFEKLDAAEKVVARRYLLQLVKPGEGTEDIRQRALLPAGNDTALRVIRRLADARLVVTTWDAATGAEMVEVTHEALIRKWTRLRNWIDQDRDFLRRRARIEAAAALWEGDKRDVSRLLAAGRPLAEGQEVLAKARPDLRATAVAFIETSVAAAARTRRHTLLTRAVVGSAALLAVSGGVLYWDLAIRTHEEHYNAYAKRRGVLEGVGRVSAEDASRRSRTLRFVRRGRLGPVIEVSAIDGTGACARVGVQDPVLGTADAFGMADNPTRPCRIEWERDGTGRITWQTIFDATGRVLLRLVYTDTHGRMAELRSGQGHLVPSGLTTISVERIEGGPNDGQDRLERYTDAFARPKPFLNAFATSLEYDARGLLVRAVSLGQDGAPVRNTGGFAEIRIKYDDHGNPIEIGLFDEHGHPARDAGGAARRTIAYDARGNAAVEAYFDEGGKPTRLKAGYAKVALAYGAHGKEIGRTYLDEAGQPIRITAGYARIARAFDREGRPVEEAYFDETDRPTLARRGYARITRTYDASGNEIATAYFDDAGKPTRHRDGYARITRRFDDRGRVVEETYLDRVEKPTRSRDGYAKRTVTYDALGLPVEEAYFDEAGAPTVSRKGYARTTRRYDGAGNAVREAYADEAGKPTLSNDGHAEVATTYDEQNRRTSEAFFDHAGQPTATRGGFAMVRLQYDARGYMVQRDYYDVTGKPALSTARYARVTRAYDARGNVVEEAFFDASGKPCRNDDGVARAVLGYNRRGERVEQAHFDEAGKPARSNNGVALVRSKYDEGGNLIEQAYFDENGRPTASRFRYARITKRYDARGNVVEEAYLDEAGRRTAQAEGYASVTSVYDPRGNRIEERYFDARSQPTRSTRGYARLTRAYDERDQLIEEAYFDEGGKPIGSTGGHARLTMIHDARGHVVDEAYFDAAGKPTRFTGGYARRLLTRDARGNATRVAHLDEHGKPTRDAEGVFGWTAVHDARGNMIEVTSLDGEGKPTRFKDGYVTVKRRYDALDNVIGRAYFDENGHPIRATFGYARVVTAYDSRGNAVEERYFDERGEPTRSTDGYVGVTRVYNSRGELLEQRRFGERRAAPSASRAAGDEGLSASAAPESDPGLPVRSDPPRL